MYVDVFVQGNKIVSNVEVLNMEIEKRIYKEMAERFGVSKTRSYIFRYIFYILHYNFSTNF